MLRRKTKTVKKGHEREEISQKKKHILDVKVHKTPKKEIKHRGQNKPVVIMRPEKYDEPVVIASNAPGTEPSEQVDRYKRQIMWSGIGFFMILIVFVWILNVKNIIKAGSASFQEKKTAENNFSETLDENFKDIKKSLDELKDVSNKVKELKDYSGSVTTTLENASLKETEALQSATPTKEIIKEPSIELDKKLDLLEQKIETTAGSPAPEVKK